MRRGYVDVADGQVHVRQFGIGDELVILLHQTAASSAMFEGFAEELVTSPLARSHRFVAMDTPGFGMSFVPDDPFDIDAWALTVLEVADAFGAETFHLLGHHTGAATAIAVAALAPHRVRSLAMIGGLVLGAEEAARWEAGVRGMTIDESGEHLAVAWHQVANIDGDPAAFPPDLALRHREAVDKLTAGTRWHEAYLSVFRSDLGSALARTGCPAILFSGTADVLHPYAGTTLAAREGIHYVELVAGAYVLDQEPTLVTAPYTRFLEELV